MPNWKKLIVSGSDANLSSLTIDGALTASSAYLESASIGHLQTIYETASVIYSSGSTKFGDTLDDTHEITGSLLVTGSITGDLTGTASIADFATTASQADNATTASHVVTASFADSSTTSSFAITASYALNAAGGGGGGGIGFSNDQTLSVDLITNASSYNILLGPLEINEGTEIEIGAGAVLKIEDFNNWSSAISSSYTTTASYTSGTASIADFATTSSHALTSISASHTEGTASISNFATSASFVETAQTASFVETAQTASYALISSQSVNNNSASGSLSFWQGSQAEYDLISASADPNTVYFVA
jgi:hypothetical protein